MSTATMAPLAWLVLHFLHLSLYVLAKSTLGERALGQLSQGQITTLLSSLNPKQAVDLSNLNSHLSKILIPRAPDTENNTSVKNYLVATMKGLNWHVEEDAFTDSTPYGVKRFTNVIATKDPAASRRIVLAAHFDSKFFPTAPENQFLGATDSAAPCAMMLDVAEALNALLDERAQRFDAGEEDDEDVADTTLQLIFFDGEEAFKDWTAADSIYGARHLAEQWATSYVSPHAKRRLLTSQQTELAGIEHFVLLDLLGAPHPLIQSYFADTHWLFDALSNVEQRLLDLGLLVSPSADGSPVGETVSFFLPRKVHSYVGHIEDDHLPFIQRGVSVLHVISSPFPRVWHTLKDDATALDMETMRQWILILRVFMAEYLNLQPRVSARDIHDELASAHFGT